MTEQDDDFRTALAMFAESARGTIADRMEIEITRAERDRIEGRMPVQGNHQPYGLLHGGASCVLAETLASMGSALNAWPDRIAMGIEINASHHRSATEGFVHGVATPLRQGRSLATWGIEIRDDEGKLVCTARVTCVLRES